MQLLIAVKKFTLRNVLFLGRKPSLLDGNPNYRHFSRNVGKKHCRSVFPTNIIV